MLFLFPTNMILPFYQKDDLLPKNTPEDDISVIIEKGDIHPRKYGTAKPPDSGHVGSAQTCPLFGGVRCWEVLSKYSNFKPCWLYQAM